MIILLLHFNIHERLALLGAPSASSMLTPYRLLVPIAIDYTAIYMAIVWLNNSSLYFSEAHQHCQSSSGRSHTILFLMIASIAIRLE